MRVNVTGSADSAKALTGTLSAAGFLVSDFMPSYTVIVEDAEEGEGVIKVDSVHCALDSFLVRHLRPLTATPVLLQTAGGIQTDNTIRIYVPRRDLDRKAVETAVLRALLEITRQDKGLLERLGIR